MPLDATLLANAMDTGDCRVSHDSQVTQDMRKIRHVSSADSAPDNGKGLAVIGTKSASILTTLFYKAFINIWSDAVTDSIMEYWLSFVIMRAQAGASYGRGS
ncbi:hypothetical protein AZE42_10190 [Rhizopogon vesiculosus]|uniref:Uncharacterized protein n=1 Tax=Rhizopogon vesiculosus TaxID=180088 RepID=A0A1J8QKS3_9AGAM|nr:hypothetical protein AZE42_10190 [Rhizopogon vesiculosus]